MKKLSILATAFLAGMGLLLAGPAPLLAQTIELSAKTDQELAKENAALERQNQEILARIRRLEALEAKGKAGTAAGAATKANAGAAPHKSVTTSMAADYPVKAAVAQSAAPPQASGYIEAYTGGAWSKDSVSNPFDSIELKYNGWVLGGAGRGNLWLAPNFSAQLDAQAEGTQYDVPGNLFTSGVSGRFSTLSYLVAGHANWRDPRTGLFGIFGGVGDAAGNGATRPLGNAGIRHGLIGLEGQLYFNALTLYGQAGYDSTFGDIGSFALFDSVHAWFLRGTGRYFFTPNFMVEGTAQYARGTTDFNIGIFTGAFPSSNFDLWQWRVKAEWKPGMLPLSFFATYEGANNRYGSPFMSSPTSERMTDNRVMVGLRLYMGQDTLQLNDRTGATLDIIDPLGTPISPLMLQIIGQTPG